MHLASSMLIWSDIAHSPSIKITTTIKCTIAAGATITTNKNNHNHNHHNQQGEQGQEQEQEEKRWQHQQPRHSPSKTSSASCDGWQYITVHAWITEGPWQSYLLHWLEIWWAGHWSSRIHPHTLISPWLHPLAQHGNGQRDKQSADATEMQGRIIVIVFPWPWVMRAVIDEPHLHLRIAWRSRTGKFFSGGCFWGMFRQSRTSQPAFLAPLLQSEVSLCFRTSWNSICQSLQRNVHRKCSQKTGVLSVLSSQTSPMTSQAGLCRPGGKYLFLTICIKFMCKVSKQWNGFDAFCNHTWFLPTFYWTSLTSLTSLT